MHAVRKDAKEANQKYYFTGKSCVNGHISKRQVSNGCCYECSTERTKEYGLNSKAKRAEYRLMNKTRIKESAKIYNENNKQNRKEYRDRNKERIAKKCKEYALRNEERLAELRKQYYIENKDKFMQHSAARRERIKDTIDYRLTCVMRQNVRRILINGEKKESRTQALHGYTHFELKSHLEKLFKDGMSWDNYGKWHIDHIIPIVWFFKNNIREVRVINALSNLQPLWAVENIKKGGRLPKC